MKSRNALFCLSAIVVMALAGALAGCNDDDEQATQPGSADGNAQAAQRPYINTKCPIMQNMAIQENVPDSLIVEFKGQKIAMCCSGCPPVWNNLSEEEKLEKLEEVGVDMAVFQP
ncbi:MAG: hypothetical protein ACLFUJ_00305 [Phycisphaerae bacterium]